MQGANATLTLTLTSPAGSEPAALQWTLAYDPSVIAGITATPAASTTAAAKNMTCAGTAGSYNCLIFGLNANPIANGPVATVNVNLSASSAGSITIGVSNLSAASPAAAPASVSGAAGTISVVTSSSTGPTNPPPVSSPPVNPPPVMPPPSSPPPVSAPPAGSPAPGGTLLITGLSCDPATLVSGTAAACVVTLNQPAPSGGASVALFSSSSELKAPAAVSVPEGVSSANFTVTASGVAANTSAVLTAALNGGVQRTLVALANSPAPTIAAPVIVGIPAGVVDAASYTPQIAQGSIFVVRGSHLAPDGFVQASGFPLPSALNGVSIAFTPAGGGPVVTPYLTYTSSRGGASQLAAILPSTTTPGTYNVTVTSNGLTSAPVSTTVVPRKFELFTADSSGTGAAALQSIDANGNYSYNRFTTGTLPGSTASAGPAHPGDFLIAYGTGMGAIPNPDQMSPGAIDLRGQTDIQVVVGGKPIAPLYAGRSPNYSGVDQINFQLPADVPTGCAVPVQVSVGGRWSDPLTMSIAPAGSAVCGPVSLSADTLSRLDQGGTLTLGNFWLAQLASASPQTAGVNESAAGAFVKYSGFHLASAAPLLNPPGSCQTSHTVGNPAQLAFGSSAAYLDAGTLTLSGPAAAASTFTFDRSTGAYSLLLGSAAPWVSGLELPLGFPSFDLTPKIAPGAYQLTGAGGADVGAFSAAVSIAQPLSLSGGIPASIDRAKDLTLSWTGGNPSDLVSVTGISGAIVGGTAAAPIYDAWTFTCTATASAGSITVPAALLSQLPATPPSGTGIGYLALGSGPQPASGNGLFTAPLTAGGNIDAGFFLGAFGAFAAANYQ